MRLPKTKARAAPSLLRCERSRNRKSRDLERGRYRLSRWEFTKQPLEKQGWASVGRDTPLDSKCCSLSDWPQSALGCLPLLPG